MPNATSLMSALLVLGTCPGTAIAQAGLVAVNQQNNLPPADDLRSKSQSLGSVLEELKATYGIKFLYRDSVIDGKALPKDRPSFTSLEEEFHYLLQQHQLQFKKLEGNVYVISPVLAAPTLPATIVPPTTLLKPAVAADVVVTGKVTQANGQPLPGVTVVVKGTTLGTSTDGNGGFSLSVPSGSVLIFSSIGFVAQEVPVTGPTLNVVLGENTKALDEVVVVGYGAQRKSDLTGSVASADLESFRNAPNTNIIQSLQGTIPGLNVGAVNSAGANPSIQVRGANTINGNANVLIVLDGIIYNGSLPDRKSVV